MRSSPSRWCSRCQSPHPGPCPLKLSEGRKFSDDRRGTAAQRGYGSQWRSASDEFLRLNPFCRECERAGRLTPARVTDHIVPHRGNQALFWDRANWQPLCEPCHNRKTGSGQ